MNIHARPTLKTWGLDTRETIGCERLQGTTADSKEASQDVPAPGWATALVKRVADDYSIEAPELTWRRSRRHFYSSGHFSPYSKDAESTVVHIGRGGNARIFEGYAARAEIVVTAGKDRKDQKHTVLHEMAHALTTHIPNLCHGPEFYAVLGELLLKYGGTLKHLRDVEGWNGRSKVARSIEEGLRLMRHRRAA